MLVGHYAPAYLIKAHKPQIPLWMLFLAVQVVDIAWSVLIVFNIERVRIIPNFTASNPLDLYYMPYTHSLVAAFIWAAGCALAYRYVPKIRPWVFAAFIGLAVLSHWMLDLAVHTTDLPLYGDQHKVGFGLWNHAFIATFLELGILFISAWYMCKKVYTENRSVKTKTFSLVALLATLQVYSLLGPIPSQVTELGMTMFFSYFVFAFLAWKSIRKNSRQH